jgi:hypothetical protein
VSEGHPDKLADRISDRVLDAFLTLDPDARVACETLLADQCVVVAGEFRTRRLEDFQAVRESTVSLVRQVLQDAGYRQSETGIDPNRCEVQVRFNGQSQDINQGVDRSDGVLGAGDQGSEDKMEGGPKKTAAGVGGGGGGGGSSGCAGSGSLCPTSMALLPTMVARRPLHLVCAGVCAGSCPLNGCGPPGRFPGKKAEVRREREDAERTGAGARVQS